MRRTRARLWPASCGRLGTNESRDALLDDVSAHPDRGSLVAVVGHASSPARAARVADAFADELVAQRTVRFRSEAFQTIARLRTRLARADSLERPALARRLAVLRGAAGAGDPTLQVASRAVPPSKPAWPRPWLLVPLAAVAAFVVGAAFVSLRTRRKPRPPEEPAAGDALLERRLKAVERAERELARRAGELAARERAATAATAATPEPEPAPPPPRPVEPDGGWNLNELERLVHTRGAEFPERADEWAAYLFHLRGHADADGRLPSSFDALVEDAFADLVAS